MTEINLQDRTSFNHWTPVTIRFSDQDSMGHVNNVAIAQYVEAGRTSLIYDIIQKFDHARLEFILAQASINYVNELHYPGVVDVGSRLTRLGNKSLTSGYGLFMGDTCVATATSVNVFVDIETHKTMSPPDDVRAKILAEIG